MAFRSAKPLNKILQTFDKTLGHLEKLQNENDIHIKNATEEVEKHTAKINTLTAEKEQAAVVHQNISKILGRAS